MLNMEDTKGSNLTTKQYLENALAHQKGVSDQIENKNKVRKLLKHFFPNRDCLTMVRPAKTERDLQRLEALEDGDIREQFLQEVKSAREKIFKGVGPKKIGGTPINGFLLIEATYAYCNAINSGRVPNVE